MRPTHELLQFFAYEHLPPHLAKVSRPFCELADELVNLLPGAFETDAPSLISARMAEWEREPIANVEATWASTKLRDAATLAGNSVFVLPSSVRLDAILRLVLEAKDCAVRAVLFKQPRREG